jgi:hypothetical protein
LAALPGVGDDTHCSFRRIFGASAVKREIHRCLSPNDWIAPALWPARQQSKRKLQCRTRRCTLTAGMAVSLHRTPSEPAACELASLGCASCAGRLAPASTARRSSSVSARHVGQTSRGSSPGWRPRMLMVFPPHTAQPTQSVLGNTAAGRAGAGTRLLPHC